MTSNPTKRRRAWTQTEREFIARFCRYALLQQIAEVLGRSKGTLYQYVHESKLPHPRWPRTLLTTVALRRAWELHQQGERIPLDLLQMPDMTERRQCSRKRWTAADDAELRSMLGRKPAAEMALLLGRTRAAVLKRMFKLGLHAQHHATSVANLHRALQADGRCVHQSAVQANTVRHLRSWNEGGVRVIHVDDYAWMLEHYRPYQTDYSSLDNGVKHRNRGPETTRPCPYCGAEVRPCNMARHSCTKLVKRHPGRKLGDGRPDMRDPRNRRAA